MATLDSSEANILDAETINWRAIVYPILVILLLIVGGFSFYYYQQNQRDLAEAHARAAMLNATTPEQLIKVADDFPGTDTATLALLSAADKSFDKRDYASAAKDYQRILSTAGTAPQLNDSAQVGLASALESDGKLDEAINAYLEVARRGAKTPYAPYAFSSAARLYEQKGDKDAERKILTEASALDSDSGFTQMAKAKLKDLNSAAQAPLIPATPPAPASPAPAH